MTFHGTKLAAMVLVAYSIAVSTVLFQTVTNNRILTPSIMGFDALYILIQALAVFAFGAIHVNGIGPNGRFFAETAIMVVFASTLYAWLFSGAARSLHLVMLVGIVFGVFFRSLSNLMQRMIDPNEFAVLQDRFLQASTVLTRIFCCSQQLSWQWSRFTVCVFSMSLMFYSWARSGNQPGRRS